MSTSAPEKSGATQEAPRAWALRLASHRLTRRSFGWVCVGISGALVNQLALWVFVQMGLGLWLSNILNTPVSSTWNFILLEALVFRSSASRRWRRYWGYLGINMSLLLVQGPLLIFLIGVMHKHYLSANVISLAVLFVLRLALGNILWWNKFTKSMEGDDSAILEPDEVLGKQSKRDPQHRSHPVRVIDDNEVRGHLYHNHVQERRRHKGRPRKQYYYDIHGLVRIVSEVKLPELVMFRVFLQSQKKIDRFMRHRNITIERWMVGNRCSRRRVESYRVNGKLFSYLEHCGSLGANFRVYQKNHGSRVLIKASPLLCGSPHVLYTNVVESILRFMLARQGYMLLHSATMELDGKGVMLSARTDTGKTGTVLKMLSEHDNIRFLSDDMTIVNAQGQAWSYPKPLTISSHTLRAVNRRALSWWQRIFLPMQSRIHSKSGRGFAFLLAKMNLPHMSINCLTQMFVPPPKYLADQLVPCRVAPTTTVNHLFIIERGKEVSQRVVGLDEAIRILLDNTEDAYGFPPYEYLRPAITLGEADNMVLARMERDILSAFLRYLPVTVLVDPNFGWADRIPELLQSGGMASFMEQFRIDSDLLLDQPAFDAGGAAPSGAVVLQTADGQAI